MSEVTVSPFSGAGLLDSGTMLAASIESKDWVGASLAGFGVLLDAAAAVMNPIAAAVSWGVGWVLDHVYPLNDWLNKLTGEAAQVNVGAENWTQVATQLTTASEDLLRSLRTTLADARSEAVDTYKALMTDMAEHVGMGAQLASAISTGLSVAAGIVQFVHDLVRDAIGDIIGSIVSLIVPTPNAISGVATKVLSWAKRLGTQVDDLVRSFSALKGLFRQADVLLGRVRKAFDDVRLGTHSSEAPSTPKPRTHEEGAAGAPGNRDNPAQGSEPASRCKEGGEPVDMATGYMFFARLDVNLPMALPLVLRRRFVSGFRHGRWFGTRWGSTLDEHLDTAGEGPALVRWDGSVLLYPAIEVGQDALPLGGADQWRLVRINEDLYRVTDPVAGLTYSFYGRGRRKWLSDQRDLEGHWIRYDRNNEGVPTAVVHHSGAQVTVSSFNSRISGFTVVGADGEEVGGTRFEFANGQLVQETTTDGATVRYQVDQVGRVITWVDSNNFSYTVRYDDKDRCVSEGPSDPNNSTYRFSYQYLPGPASGGHTTVIGNPDGTQQRYEVDHRDLVLARVDQSGNRYDFSYDEAGRKLTETDPLGNTTTFEWDDQSRLVGLIEADGTATRISYDTAGLPVRFVDPTGAATTQRFDESGRLIERVSPDLSVERWTYEDDQVLYADPTGRTVTLWLDRFGLPVRAEDGVGVQLVERNGVGLPVQMTDPVGAVTELTWSDKARLLARVNPDRTTESWVYDGQGNLTEQVDTAGRSTRYTYGTFDALNSIHNFDGSLLQFSYDAERRLTSVTNQNGQVWRYERDAVGQVVAEVDYDQRRTSYQLDAAGRLVTSVNPAGQRLDFELDAVGRIVRRHADDEMTSFSYNAAGQLLAAEGPQVALERTYDAAGRLVAESVNGAETTWDFDAAGRRLERHTPGGASSQWLFDEAGQRAGLQLAGSGLRFARDQVGRALATEFAGGRIDSAFDSMGRLASRSAVGGQSSPWQVNYGYGPGGELLAVHDSVQGQRRYSLDAAGRITSVEGDTATEHYTYDPAGNITNAQWYTPNTDAATQGQRSYQGSLLVQAGRDRYEYDTAGRLIGRSRALLSGGTKQWRFTWNSLNQLTTATTPDGHRWTYHYDALNRRVSKTHHDLTGQVVETYRFTWDGPTLVEQTHTTASASTTTTWEHEGFTPIAQTTLQGERSQAQVDAEFAAIITDLVGTPIRLLDATGATTWTNQASTWGATDANTTMPLRFAGQYHDTETGLFYNLHRYYNPDTGRYVTADPLGLAPSPNPHAYVTNPTTAIDPLGLSAETHGLHEHGTRAVKSAVPSAFVRTEALSGRASQRNVNEIANSMRDNGWQGAPIDVVELNGQRIVVDGHHRLAAARRTGIDVQYQVVDPSTVIGEGRYTSIDDILNAAYSVGRDRLR